MGISPPLYEGICPNDLVKIVPASDYYPDRKGRVIVVRSDGHVVVQLYPQESQSAPNDGIRPKEAGDEVTFDPLSIVVVLRVSQHDFFQFSTPDEITGRKYDRGEVRRVLDNGDVEMKLFNGVSVTPLFLLLGLFLTPIIRH